jgi:hypothetical protein
MELVSVYLYNRIPIELNNINVITFHKLKREGWYNDTRTNKKFTMLNKRIEVDGQWYRALLRFQYTGQNDHGEQLFELSMPTPFIITQCEPVESVTSARWKDNKTYHGPNLGMTGYLQAGVPTQIIDDINEDLKICAEYN